MEIEDSKESKELRELKELLAICGRDSAHETQSIQTSSRCLAFAVNATRDG